MDALELTRTVRHVVGQSSEDVDHVWEAVMYRTNLLRSQLTTQDLAHLMAGFAKSRRVSGQYVDLLTSELIPKVSSLGIDSASMCLHACTRLNMQSSKIKHLADSLSSSLLTKIADNSRDSDLSIILLSLTKLEASHIEAFKTKVVSSMSRRLEKIACGQTLSTLVFCFCPQPNALRSATSLEDDDEPFEDSVACTGKLTNVDFLKTLLVQASKRLSDFNQADLALLLTGLGNLRMAQDDKEIIPPHLTRQISQRLTSDVASFAVYDLVSLFSALSPFLFPDVTNQPIVNELIYRVRDLSVKQALAILRNVTSFKEAMTAASAEKLTVAVFHRLMLPGTRMTAEEVALLAAYGKHSLIGREAMLFALVSLQKNGPSDRLAELLEVYAEAGVRDSHWLHICSHANLEISSSIAESLAKLGLPDCADKLGVFEKFPKTPSLVYAGAIFELLGRKPKSLDFQNLAIDFDCRENPDIFRLVQAAKGNFSDILNFKQDRIMSPFESHVFDCVSSWTGVTLYRKDHRLAVHLPSLADWMGDRLTSPSSASVQATSISQDSFVLLECLDERDWYHESDNLQSKSMRERKHTLRAEREAELAALRRAGWLVLEISEKSCGTDLEEFILSQFLSVS